VVLGPVVPNEGANLRSKTLERERKALTEGVVGATWKSDCVGGTDTPTALTLVHSAALSAPRSGCCERVSTDFGTIARYEHS